MLKDCEVMICGTDRDGNKYVEANLSEPYDLATLDDVVACYRKVFPKCIHIEMHIAFPDPDFMRTKNENRDTD